MAKAPPDGYTIGFATSNLAVNPSLYPKLPFTLTKDLSYVTLPATGVYVLVVHPSVPAKSVNELIGLVKTSPQKYNASFSFFPACAPTNSTPPAKPAAEH